ncbi:hypothetical protein XANCAGTX0491_009991 [Xanthoria calcicola]
MRLCTPLLDLIFDLTILADARRYCERPEDPQSYPTEWRPTMESAFNEIKASLAAADEAWTHIDLAKGPPHLIEDPRVFMTSGTNPYSAQGVRRLQAAKKALDLVWSDLDRICLKTLGRTLRDLPSDGVKPREIHRTPDWVSPQPTADTQNNMQGVPAGWSKEQKDDSPGHQSKSQNTSSNCF